MLVAEDITKELVAMRPLVLEGTSLLLDCTLLDDLEELATSGVAVLEMLTVEEEPLMVEGDEEGKVLPATPLGTLLRVFDWLTVLMFDEPKVLIPIEETTP